MTRINLHAICLTGLLLLHTRVPAVRAQVDTPPVDSLVASFIEQGSLSRWRPHELFDGCPQLESWQRRGISLLMTAPLSFEREDQLAVAWASPLERCADPILDQWYFDTTSRSFREGRGAYLFGLRRVLGRTATPSVQTYLQSVMLDASMPEDAREWAGIQLVEQMEGADVRAVWRLAFESEQVSWRVLRYASRRLLTEDARWFGQEVAQRIRRDPALAGTFPLAVVLRVFLEDAAQAQRESIARAIEDASAGAAEERRRRMDALAAWLRRGKQPIDRD